MTLFLTCKLHAAAMLPWCVRNTVMVQWLYRLPCLPVSRKHPSCDNNMVWRRFFAYPLPLPQCLRFSFDFWHFINFFTYLLISLDSMLPLCCHGEPETLLSQYKTGKSSWK